MRYRYRNIFLGVFSYYILTSVEKFFGLPERSLVYLLILLLGSYSIFKRLKDNKPL